MYSWQQLYRIKAPKAVATTTTMETIPAYGGRTEPAAPDFDEEVDEDDDEEDEPEELELAVSVTVPLPAVAVPLL